MRKFTQAPEMCSTVFAKGSIVHWDDTGPSPRERVARGCDDFSTQQAKGLAFMDVATP